MQESYHLTCFLAWLLHAVSEVDKAEEGKGAWPYETFQKSETIASTHRGFLEFFEQKLTWVSFASLVPTQLRLAQATAEIAEMMLDAEATAEVAGLFKPTSPSQTGHFS